MVNIGRRRGEIRREVLALFQIIIRSCIAFKRLDTMGYQPLFGHAAGVVMVIHEKHRLPLGIEVCSSDAPAIHVRYLFDLKRRK